ncbi:unnamed protein product [Clavelina lepadiformis]|uniref:Uncharacterized protein n=1 Tax=Clavelina lepadiformis TaxID=159417 RepID=A0ABP0GKJ5_CLALP
MKIFIKSVILLLMSHVTKENDEVCMPVRRSSDLGLSEVTSTINPVSGRPGKQGALGPPGPQGIPGLPGVCGCSPSEIERLTAKIEDMNETITNLTAMIANLNYMHQYVSKVDRCDHHPCLNRGACTSLDGGFACNCDDGYEGHDCSIRIECKVPDAPTHGSISTELESVPHLGSISYSCDEGYGMVDEIDEILVATCRKNKTWTSEPPQCVVDQCNLEPCGENGVCVNKNNYFVCDCDEGYSGHDCSVIIDPCHSNPCGERATCISSNQDFSCECDPGYEGDDCSDICTNTEGVGMADGRVDDDDITASTHYDNQYLPKYGRLDQQSASGHQGCWHPKTVRVGEWLQVDLKTTTLVVGVVTQGDPQHQYWVSAFTISYGNSEDELQTIQYQNGTDVVFRRIAENTDEKAQNYFPQPIHSRYFRFIVQEWHVAPTLRMEYLSC